MAKKEDEVNQAAIEKKAASESVTVTLRQLVDGSDSLTQLANMPLRGIPRHRVKSAYKVVIDILTAHQDTKHDILREHGAEPSGNGGVKIRQDAPNYKEAVKALDDYERPELKKEIVMGGIIPITYDEFLDALPPSEAGSEKEDKRIAPKILAELDWLILDPEPPKK